MSGAYIVNGHPVAPEAFYAVACDPRRSVVVEACAGAGKTWMLVSRMLRAMMDGTPPHQILAITFTRKAAGEMRTRLQEWMHEFAHADDAACDQALRDRGVPEAEVPGCRDKLRGLQAAWMADGRSVEIHTILGWFAKLVQGAPLDLLHELGLPPDMQLIEDTQTLWPQVWGRFLQRADADAALRQALADSIADVGRHNTEAWLTQALSSRLEIELADRAGRLLGSVEGVSALNLAWADGDDLAAAWRQPVVNGQMWALARELGRGAKKGQQDAAVALEMALGQADDAAAEKGIRQALFTNTGGLRKALGESDLLMWAAAWLGDWADACAQALAQARHQRQCTLAQALLATYRQLKTEMGVADMVDLELAASRLMADPVMSGWVQERLDHQVRHVLMDEFQDTSPLQWHTLRAWLSAYAGAGGGSSGQQAPSVFLVGDPKQSIYRFRRADPKVFQAARRFVVDGLDGQHLACDHTRRNAQAVIGVLNAVMGQVAEAGRFPDFRPHTTSSAQPGQLIVLPQVQREAAGKDEAAQAAPPSASASVTPADPALPEGWRDTLLTPRHELEVTRRELEARQIASLVRHMIDVDGVPPQEIFVLARRRVSLEAVAQALNALQIAHLAPESDLLTDKAEVQDLMAAVEALLSPGNNLALAHALRSPLFDVSDDELQWLAARLPSPQASWMATLRQLGPQDGLPHRLHTAQASYAAWQQALPHLPPHDLLERIVRDTGYRQALVRQVPHGQWQAALFHVDTLLAHSLAANAGRDVTPYTWLRQLRRDPPKLPPRAAAHAVQLMTVHGAKGLEADVVMLADMDAEGQHSATYSLMIDWPEGQSAPLRCAFVASESQCPPSLRALRDAEDLADEVEGMNALYVALTRARKTLVFSSTQPRSAQAHSWWGWLHRAATLPAPMSVPMSVPDGGPSGAPMAGAGAMPAQDTPPTIQLPGLPALTRSRAEPTALDARPPTPVTPVASRDAVLGQWVHAALEHLTVLPASLRSDARLTQIIALTQAGIASRNALPPDVDWPAWQAAALRLTQRIVNAPPLKPWLAAEGWAWAGNEVPMADAQGVMRLDRLVATAQPDGRWTWWVIDYKLHHDPLASADHQAQMARYVTAVQAAQPEDAVGGAFITSQGEWQVWRAPAV